MCVLVAPVFETPVPNLSWRWLTTVIGLRLFFSKLWTTTRQSLVTRGTLEICWDPLRHQVQENWFSNLSQFWYQFCIIPLISQSRQGTKWRRAPRSRKPHREPLQTPSARVITQSASTVRHWQRNEISNINDGTAIWRNTQDPLGHWSAKHQAHLPLSEQLWCLRTGSKSSGSIAQAKKAKGYHWLTQQCSAEFRAKCSTVWHSRFFHRTFNRPDGAIWASKLSMKVTKLCLGGGKLIHVEVHWFHCTCSCKHRHKLKTQKLFSVFPIFK